MGQLFGRASTHWFRAALFGGVAVPIVAGAITYAIYRSPYKTMVNATRNQEVPFSHQHHAGGLGIDCRYCHTSVEDSSFAGIPPTETCMTCHSRVWTDAPLLAPVRQSLSTRQPLKWNRVHQLPDFVFFNHSIHVRKGVGCSTCHGRVDQMPLMRKAESLEMRWCLECHEAPEKYLRPRSELYNMAWEPPADQAKQGAKLLSDYHISRTRLNQLRDCSMCHR